MKSIFVKDFMTKKVVKISSDANAAEASKIMGEKRIGSLAVEGRVGLLGLVTERDIISKVVAREKKLNSIKMVDILSRPIPMIPPDAFLKRAARTMIAEKGRLLVYERDNLVGIVTASDLVRAISSLKEATTGIQDVMTKRVFAVEEGSSILKVVKIMAEERIGSVLVRRDKKPYAIFAERDLMSKVLSEDVKLDAKVEKYASSPLKTAPVDISLRRAADIMVSNHVRRLPIVEDRDVVGIVTARDLVEAYSKMP